MTTASPAYSKLSEEPKQDEPEIDTPDGEELLSRDRPYPSQQIRFPPSQRYIPPSTFPTQTVAIATRHEKIPCGYLCLLIYVVVSVFFCIPIGFVAVVLFNNALTEHRNGRRNNCTALISFMVATSAIVMSVIISVIILVVGNSIQSK